MGVGKSWREWWRGFLGFSLDNRAQALTILNDRYVKESQQIARFTRQAERMQYPQFRDKLLAIAADKAQHLEWLAEKIKLLGGRPPDVPPLDTIERTSWQYLSEDLEEEQRCAVELLEQAGIVRAELPTVADVLERIHADGRKHRETLREMLMRSDPQSHLSYLG